MERALLCQVLMNNIKRVVNLVRTLRDAWEFIKSLWSWENKAKSTAAFIVSILLLTTHTVTTHTVTTHSPLTLSPLTHHSHCHHSLTTHTVTTHTVTTHCHHLHCHHSHSPITLTTHHSHCHHSHTHPPPSRSSSLCVCLVSCGCSLLWEHLCF